MKPIFLFLLGAMLLSSSPRAADKPTALDLVGKWQGAVEFGKFKFRLTLRIAKTEAGLLAVTLDNPDQGVKGMPVAALLFNYPDVRIEIDQFGTAYLGKLSEDRNQITGQFEEGPGGRPIQTTFKRSTEPDAPEPEKVFTFAKGEARDIRGHWKGNIEPMPGMKMTIGLNIGRIPDGSFKATMDILEQGAKDIPSSSVAATNDSAKLQWQAFQTVFDAKLSQDGKQLAGTWKGMGRPSDVKFERIDAPLTLLPKDLSFERDSAKPEDIRGYWKGTLEIPNGKLRLVVKVGRAPDGSYAGTLASIDQGGREFPATSATFEAPKVFLEWKGIRGKFEGTLTTGGDSMEGKWEQMGNPLPLKLERTTAAEAEKKS